MGSVYRTLKNKEVVPQEVLCWDMQLAWLIMHNKISFMPPCCALPHSCPGKAKHRLWASTLQRALWGLRVLLPGYEQGLVCMCDHNLPFHSEELSNGFSRWLTFSTPCSLSERLRNMMMGDTVGLKGQFPTCWREAEEQMWEDHWGSVRRKEAKISRLWSTKPHSHAHLRKY